MCLSQERNRSRMGYQIRRGAWSSCSIPLRLRRLRGVACCVSGVYACDGWYSGWLRYWCTYACLLSVLWRVSSFCVPMRCWLWLDTSCGCMELVDQSVIHRFNIGCPCNSASLASIKPGPHCENCQYLRKVRSSCSKNADFDSWQEPYSIVSSVKSSKLRTAQWLLYMYWFPFGIFELNRTYLSYPKTGSFLF